MKTIRRSVRSLTVFAFLLLTAVMMIVMISLPASTQGSDFSLCDGLRGADFGLCRAGVAIGCDIDDTQPACAQIADEFEKITGEPPPWVLLCPCFSSSPDAHFCFGSDFDCSDGVCFLQGFESNGLGRIRSQATLFGNDLCEDTVTPTGVIQIFGISDAEAQACLDLILQGPNCNP